MTGESAFSYSFGSPWMLVLLGLVPLVCWMALRSRSDLTAVRRAFSIALRCVVLVLLVLALSRLRISQRNDRLAVYFAVDRSESIPAEQREACRRYVEEAARIRGLQSEDRVGIIAFGRRAGIESTP